MLQFTLYKSKQFIFLISLYSEQSKTKRYVSNLQTVVRKNTIIIEYVLYNKLHRDDRDENGRILPAVIWGNGRKEWYQDGKRLM